MTIRFTQEFPAKELTELFHSVGWELNTDPAILQTAMRNASHTVSAWEDDKLVGIIRSMDDGCWNANIDCLIVHKDYQHKGIGTLLITTLLNRLAGVMTIYVSPNERINFHLYENCGFREVVDGGLLEYVSPIVHKFS